MKKVLLMAFLILLLSACKASDVDYPNKDINGIIQWGAGGGTDIVSRALAPHVEKALGKTIVLQNKPGATGAIAMQYVYDEKSDGYTLLFGAENPQLYEVMGISKLSYSDFEPIIVIGRETAVVVVNEDSPFRNIEQLIEYAKKDKTLKLGTTGPGGVPFVVASLMKSIDNAEFIQVPYDGDGPVVTALLGKHVDFTITKLSTVKELLRSGDIRVLASVSEEPIIGYEDIPAIGELRDGYNKYLPWGPFYGVYAKKDIPNEAKDKLIEAFQNGFNSSIYQEFLKENAITPVGSTGAEALEFLDSWKRASSWLLYDAKGAKYSPEEFGIERIE